MRNSNIYEEPASRERTGRRACVLHTGHLSGKLNGILAQNRIKTFHKTPATLLCSIEDYFGLKTPGSYSISCECGKVYIGQTEPSIEVH